MLGVVRRPEHLTHEVVRSVEAGHLDQLWKLLRVQFEVLYGLHGPLDVLQGDEDVDEFAFEVREASDEHLGILHLVVVLDETDDQIRNVKLRLELLLGDQDRCANQVAITDHLPRIIHELLLTYLQIESLDPLQDALGVHDGQRAVDCRSFHCFAYLESFRLLDSLYVVNGALNHEGR